MILDNVHIPDSFPLYSVYDLESETIDREMFNHEMNKFANLIACDISKSLESLTYVTETPALFINSLIRNHVININNIYDLRAQISDTVSEKLAVRKIHSQYNVDTMSDEFYHSRLNDLVNRITDCIVSAVNDINSVFIEHELPYFECMLPYKVKNIDFYTNHVFFEKIGFDEFIVMLRNM